LQICILVIKDNYRFSKRDLSPIICYGEYLWTCEYQCLGLRFCFSLCVCTRASAPASAYTCVCINIFVYLFIFGCLWVCIHYIFLYYLMYLCICISIHVLNPLCLQSVLFFYLTVVLSTMLSSSIFSSTFKFPALDIYTYNFIMYCLMPLSTGHSGQNMWVKAIYK